MLKIALIVVSVLIGVLILGFLVLFFIEKNSVQPESKRKWSDPNFRDE